jgi:antitoxin (DNA-binding transcriptional repressor) of toxin-antitoxin stability system
VEVTVHEAKTHLSKLIALVEGGEEVVICRGTKPAVRLVRVETELQPPPRQWGFAPDGWVSDDFDDPLPDEFWGFDKDE